MGEQSFVKGLVQVVRSLSYNTALKLTASRYYIPSGRSIQSVSYLHDEENTAVSKPDSLKKAFETSNGRVVYDGDGIAPDVEVSPEKPSLLQTSLMQKNMFFEYANYFAANNDTLIEKMGSEQLYNDFLSFVENQNFNYKTPSERYLSKIDSTLKKRDLEASNHLEALEKNIQEYKKQAFSEEREELEKRLYLELIARYKGQKGQTEASLPYDPFVNEAVSLLHDSKRYNNILSP